MAVMSRDGNKTREFRDSRASTLTCLAYVVVILVSSWNLGEWALAVYCLSFWHYYLYWLAYRHGAVSLRTFKRDAVLMKSVALAMLASVYFRAPIDYVSVLVLSAGFLLNLSAARALGSDRTYYGHEVAGLSWQKVTRFPYSWISHPMLLGNIAAYGGTLLNADFRSKWWQLGYLHICLNIGLLIMENHVEAKHLGGQTNLGGGCEEGPPIRWRVWVRLVASSAVVGGALGAGMSGTNNAALGAAIGAGSLTFANLLRHYYGARSFRGGRASLLFKKGIG